MERKVQYRLSGGGDQVEILLWLDKVYIKIWLW